MDAILKNEWLAELLLQNRGQVTEYWIEQIRYEGIPGYQTITDEQLRAELPPTVDSMIYAFQTGDTEGPRQHSVGVIRHRLTFGFLLPDLQMSLHALQVAVMRIVRDADVGNEKELEALDVSCAMYYMVALIAAGVYEQLRVEQQKRFAYAYELGVTLSKNLNLDEVIDTAVEKVAEYVKGDSVALLLVRPEGKCCELQAYHNLDVELQIVLPDICESLGCGITYTDTCEISNVCEDKRLVEWSAMLACHNRMALACMPLFGQQEHLGRLVILWSQPHEFAHSEVDFLLALCSHIASAVQNALLYEEAQGKRELDVLLNASRHFASSLDTQDILTKVAHMPIELIPADIITVSTLDFEHEWFRRTAYYAGKRVSKHMVDRVLEVITPDEEDVGFSSLGQDFLSGKPLIVSNKSELPEGLMPVADIIGSALVIPLITKNMTLGAFSLISLDTGAFAETDFALARGLGDLAAVAIENARLYEHELRIAETLQRSFLPATMPNIEGYETAAYYRPARAEAVVGGDFYDLFTTTGGCTSIIIGDVSGKGLQASIPTAMGKYMVRAYASENPSPSSLLERFNRSFSENVPEGMFMTALYGTLDPRDHSFIYVSAGHNPPLLYSAVSGQVTEIPVAGLSLGIMHEVKYEDKELQLQPGDVLLLYTDGATDVKENGYRLEIEGLEELFLKSAHKSAEEIIRDVSEGILEFSHGKLPDDVALVVLKRREKGSE